MYLFSRNMKIVKSSNIIFYLYCVIFVSLGSSSERTSGQQIATIVETCRGIEREVLQKDKLSYVKMPCQDPISMINKVCEFVLIPSEVKVFTTCSSSKLLQSILKTVGLNHQTLYEDKCTCRSSHQQNFAEFPNPILKFIFDAVTNFYLRTTVVIIDSYTGISALELQRMFSAMRKATIIVNLDSEDAMTKKLRRGNRFRNFIVACGESHLNSLIKHAEKEELFNFPYFWLILTENANRVKDMIIHNDVEYTWNITVAEVMRTNDEKTSLNHNSVHTEIPMVTDSFLMERLVAACSSKRLTGNSATSAFHKHADNIEENDIGYTLYDYRVKCKGNFKSMQLGNWTTEAGFEVHNIDPSTRMSLKGCNFTIALIIMEPYVMTGSNFSTLSGLDIDILEILAKKLEFSYTFIFTNFTNPGTRLENGSWTNIFKILTEDDSVDFLLPTVYLTSSRSADMHFTARLYEISGSLVIKTPSLNADMDDYIRPFSAQVWFVLFICILIVSICMTLTYLLSPFGQPTPRHHDLSGEEKYTKYPKYGLWNSLYTTCSALLQQGTDAPPRYISGRIIFATIFATSVLIIQSYSSLLISFLTTDFQKMPFRNVKELAENRDYSIGMLTASYLREVITSSDDEHLKKIWKKMSAKPDNMVETAADGLDKAMREKYAFLVPDTLVNRVLRKNCSYIAPITNMLKSYKCIATRKYFPHISTFSTVINTLRETGLLNQLYQRYFPDIKSSCKDKMEHQQIDFFNILFLIYLFVAGSGISLVVILIERCIHLYQQRLREKHIPKDESKGQPQLPWNSTKLARPKFNTIYFAGGKNEKK